MTSEPHRVSVLTLAREELRTLPRRTFALGAVAVVLALLAPFAALATEGPDSLPDHLLFFWVIAQLVVAIVLASRVAAARRTRFVESLYTTPLRPSTWLAAQALVGAALTGLVLLAYAPFILVHVGVVGVHAQLGPLLVAALGMAAFAVALGLFCGVIVGDAGPGAAAGLAGGIAFLSFVLLIVHGIASMEPPSPTQETVLRLTALSPLALVLDAVGIHLFETAPVDPWRPALGLAAMVVGLAGAAWVAYTRGQSPVGWEARRARAPVIALVALALVVPVAAAEVSFVPEEDGPDWVLSHGEHTRVAFVPRGTPVTDEEFRVFAPFSWEPLVNGADNELDALVMLMVAPGETVRDVRIQVMGDAAMQVVGGGVLAGGEPAGHAHAGESFDPDAEPEGPLRPVYRVPVVLRPVGAIALHGTPGLVEVDTTFRKDASTLESRARLTLQSDVPGATVALLAAGAPFPLLAFGALVTRRIRTR